MPKRLPYGLIVLVMTISLGGSAILNRSSPTVENILDSTIERFVD